MQKLLHSLPDRQAIGHKVGQASGNLLNSSVRRTEVKRLEDSLGKHEQLREDVTQTCARLFELRQRVAAEVIEAVEDYVNRLASSPKDFDRSVRRFRIEVNRFDGTVQRMEAAVTGARKIGTRVGLAGATAGVGLAAFGPSAALALATTFGTASTGAAISTLSGAAASQAALAWLGGGALAAGGGGVAAGNALLALAGPVGWTVGGLALVSSGAYLRYRNGDVARKARQERLRVEGELRSLRTARKEVVGLVESTRKHADGTLRSVCWLRDRAPSDYRQFEPRHKELLGALINHVRSLSEHIRREVVLDAAC